MLSYSQFILSQISLPYGNSGHPGINLHDAVKLAAPENHKIYRYMKWIG